MNPILSILINRDLLSPAEAQAALREARRQIHAGINAEAVLADMNIGPEYLDDLLGD